MTSTEDRIAPHAPPPPLEGSLSGASLADAGLSEAGWREAPRRGRGFSLRTLIVLRWLTILGQSVAILTASQGLHFPLPLWPCLIVIAVSAAVNVGAMARVRRLEASLPDGRTTAVHLGFDIFQLGLLALIAVGVLFFWSEPLPWRAHENFHLPLLYRLGMAMALVTGVVFTAGYAWRVAADAEKLELALATTQDVLQREQRLAALGGLAAAAAHELGTPLATIQVVAKELQRASAPDSDAAEDAALILQQAERCRGILTQLSQQPEGDDALYADVALKALLEEVVEPHRGFDLNFEVLVKTPPGQPAPRVRRMPEVVHGLSTLVENAADFAASTVRVQALVDAGWIEIAILDDGPGFASDILPRLGEPYVTSRPQGKARLALAAQIAAATSRRRNTGAETPIAPSQGGMGLGFFIARTLLERTGGVVSVGQGLPRPEVTSDARSPARGARVAVRWARPALEVAA